MMSWSKQNQCLSPLYRRAQSAHLSLKNGSNTSTMCRDSAMMGVGLLVSVFRIVSAALSIPGSNAFCERVFSLMNAKWRAERNRASLSLIKNKLQIYLNYEKSCREFHNYVLTEPKLLSAAASGEKYYWRRKSATCTLHNGFCVFGIWHTYSCDTY